MNIAATASTMEARIIGSEFIVFSVEYLTWHKIILFLLQKVYSFLSFSNFLGLPLTTKLLQLYFQERIYFESIHQFLAESVIPSDVHISLKLILIILFS